MECAPFWSTWHCPRGLRGGLLLRGRPRWRGGFQLVFDTPDMLSDSIVRAGRAASAEEAGAELTAAARELDALNGSIYRLSVFMMAMLREGRVGRQVDDALPPGLLKPR